MREAEAGKAVALKMKMMSTIMKIRDSNNSENNARPLGSVVFSLPIDQEDPAL